MTSKKCAIRARSPRIGSAEAASTAISMARATMPTRSGGPVGEETLGLDLLEGLLEILVESTSPQEVKRLIKAQGGRAVVALADRFGKAPLAAGAPRLILELAARSAILAVLGEKLATF
jgi:hypothetical protein